MKIKNRVSDARIPKGTKITFTGKHGRRYRGTTKSAIYARELGGGKEISFVDDPVIIPERRKRISVGCYVMCDKEYILEVISGYRIHNDNSLFTGIARYTNKSASDDNWIKIPEQVHWWYAQKREWHHRHINTVFKTVDELTEFLMLEML